MRDDGELTPIQRSMQARLAAHLRWSQENDRVAATAPARKGFITRFEREVDPDNLLSPQERARRADSAMKAHMLRMSLASSKARKRKR